MSINESLKKTIDDLDLDRRVEDLNRLAKKTFEDAKVRSSVLAAENRGKVDEWVAKATEAVDARTDGKYHDKMQKFSVAVGSAVDKVAERGSAATSADPAPGAPGTAFEPQYAPTDAPVDAPVDSVPAAGESGPDGAGAATSAPGEGDGLGWPEADGRVR